MTISNMDVAERFFAAIQDGDLETVRASYHPEAQIWHNFDQLNQTPEQNLRVLAWMVRKVKDRRYEEVRRIETPTGFAQQHVLRGIAPNGELLECPAAVFCTVEDGLITLLEEYLDTNQTAVLSK